MGVSEMLIIGWTLVAPIVVFLVATLLIYFVVRKAVKDELKKSGITISSSLNKPN